MIRQSMLSQPVSSDLRFTRNVLVKALLLFLAANLLFAFTTPLPALGRLSAYNHLFPGRPRLPFGERPDLAYNLSLFSLDAMFASHELEGHSKPADEYRIILIGDSSVWGFLLEPEQTLSARLNAAGLTTPDGKRLRAYNLGYPTMSLTKDLLMLSRAVRYQTDLIVWLVTLESFPDDKQLVSPIVQHNPRPVRELITTYSLSLNADAPTFVVPSRWEQTIIGQRRALADWLRLQLYGVMWAATGIDQYYPAAYEPPQKDLPADETFHGLKPPILAADDLALDVLTAGVKLAGSVPVLFVNEPAYISTGENSDIRYNFFYPRWAYDQYRQMMAERSREYGWYYLDVWDLVPAIEFTNSAIHLTPAGEGLLADKVSEAIISINGGRLPKSAANPSLP
jgi:hypothetical protein